MKSGADKTQTANTLSAAALMLQGRVPVPKPPSLIQMERVMRWSMDKATEAMLKKAADDEARLARLKVLDDMGLTPDDLLQQNQELRQQVASMADLLKLLEKQEADRRAKGIVAYVNESRLTAHVKDNTGLSYGPQVVIMPEPKAKPTILSKFVSAFKPRTK